MLNWKFIIFKENVGIPTFVGKFTCLLLACTPSNPKPVCSMNKFPQFATLPQQSCLLCVPPILEFWTLFRQMHPHTTCNTGHFSQCSQTVLNSGKSSVIICPWQPLSLLMLMYSHIRLIHFPYSIFQNTPCLMWHKTENSVNTDLMCSTTFYFSSLKQWTHIQLSLEIKLFKDHFD